MRGVFSTRSADRPNPIGLHPVTILDIDGTRDPWRARGNRRDAHRGHQARAPSLRTRSGQTETGALGVNRTGSDWSAPSERGRGPSAARSRCLRRVSKRWNIVRSSTRARAAPSRSGARTRRRGGRWAPVRCRTARARGTAPRRSWPTRTAGGPSGGVDPLTIELDVSGGGAGHVLDGETQRSISSSALGRSDGSSASPFRARGWSRSCSTPPGVDEDADEVIGRFWAPSADRLPGVVGVVAEGRRGALHVLRCRIHR